VDYGNQYGTRPTSILLQLYRGNDFRESVLAQAPYFSFSFTELDRVDGDGVAYSYEVREAPVSGYTTTYSGIHGQHILNSMVVTILGDVNGDGSVDNRDVAYLARYLAGWEGYTIVGDAADVNRDGLINDADVIYLSRHLSGWDGYDLKR
jgi:hypothetical protein